MAREVAGTLNLRRTMGEAAGKASAMRRGHYTRHMAAGAGCSDYAGGGVTVGRRWGGVIM